MPALLVIAIASSPASGAAPSSSLPLTAAPVTKCPSARAGLFFYHRRYHAVPHSEQHASHEKPKTCARVLYLAHRWQRKAHAARMAFDRWYRHEFEWRSWLPPVWKRLIACETFSNFRHDSGTYQGAFGFHYGSWDRFKLLGYPADAFDATPREQYEVALAIWRRFGFSGWGCANG